jgi:3-oxoacyl-[acyl-carrier-protein] synthase-3
MRTDSERLMQEGVATGVATFSTFLNDLGWSRGQIAQTICHQVGLAHRKLMLESLGLDAARDFTTVESLGNTGSVALPITLARAIEAGRLAKNDRVALLGIGSGIHCVMLGLEWQTAQPASSPTLRGPHTAATDEGQRRTNPQARYLLS